MFFEYDREIILHFRKIVEATYNRTKNCWNITYTIKSFENFKSLSIPNFIEQTSERRTQKAATNLDKTPIATRVANPLVKEKDGGNPEAGIVSKTKRKKIFCF